MSASASASRASTPASQQDPSAVSSPDGADSLSSLTDTGSCASSPEVELATALKTAPQKTPGTSQKGRSRGGADAHTEGDEGDDLSDDADGDLDDSIADDLLHVAEVAAEGHHDVSAKTVPSGQGAGKIRPTQGGKGRKGEEALEHAVATREEVERRRARLKEENGVGVAGARELERDAQAFKVKEEDQEDVEVVHGEEAEELTAAAPVSGPLNALHHDLSARD